MPAERILSQHEIDELIRDLASEQGAAEAEVARTLPASSAGGAVPYDFRRPSKFSRDQLRSVERIHQQFGRLLGILLGARLRTDLSARVVSVQQLTYGEFIRSVPNPSLLGVLDFGQSGDRVVLQLSLEMALGIYERLAGGSGSSPSVSGREPTDIELHVLRRQVMGVVADAYRQAWATLQAMPMTIRDLETNPTYVNLVLDQDTVLWIALEVQIDQMTDSINLCLPYSALEPLLPKLSNEYLLRAQGKPQARDRERLEQLLRDTKVPLQAVLGKVDLEIRELLDLRVGDVLVLDTGIHDEVHLYVADRPKFSGFVGRVGERLAVQLTGPAREASEPFDLDDPEAAEPAQPGEGAQDDDASR
ncbi:flagellar motor switch protein FliM [Carboxydochorda subterranea]|uniref:Flagellar motor switch protein FliM n=1 Tax=Carboxydichorda subterranea TaxID=3109565 RepID=A0ABZ1C0N4_9FIRM|nr:flagellar motor switch protein FliM [Limnochorda sp. L945t]WRP17887.1 flagellar motor switch protein FliM [Limnochorda sp. L945t]